MLHAVGAGSRPALDSSPYSHQARHHPCTGADDITRGELQLPDRVMRELQAEAGVMSRMRHPK